jgi:hypothetical protein
MTSYKHENGDIRELPAVSAAEETAILERDKISQIHTVTRAFSFADLQEADQSITIAFAAALPTGAVVIGGGVRTISAIDNAGDTAGVVVDIGHAGDVDAFCDGATCNAAGIDSGVSGVSLGMLVGAVTPTLTVIPSVNGNTLTKGSAVAYLSYFRAY